MTETQCVEGEANRTLTNNPEQTQVTPNPAMNPTLDRTEPRRKPLRTLSGNKAQLP